MPAMREDHRRSLIFGFRRTKTPSATALEQLQLLMGATKPVSTGGTLSEQPDWQTRLKACRLALAITFAVIPEFQDQYRQTPVDHRTLRLDR
jgi:hypothetical protein